MIRQPCGVWKTGGALYGAEERAASKSREAIGFLLSKSVEKDFGLHANVKTVLTSQNRVDFNSLTSCKSGNKTPGVRSVTYQTGSEPP